MTTLDGLHDRLLRQARKTTPDGDADLAALVRATLAESIGKDGNFSTSYDSQGVRGDGAELMAKKASALSVALGKAENGKTVGRSESVPETIYTLWHAMAGGWRTASQATQAELATLLVASTYGTFTEKESEKINQALGKVFKELFKVDPLVKLLALGTGGTAEVVVRRGVHTLAEKAPKEQLLFAAACLGAVQQPQHWEGDDKEQFLFIRDACADAVRRVDEAARIVKKIPFSRESDQPPHLRLTMPSPREFQFAWHTSSHQVALDADVVYFKKWLDKAVKIVRASVSSDIRSQFTIRLLVNFVENRPCWGNDPDNLPPIVKVLKRTA